MRIDDLQYDLPSELIAQQPAERRDESRLMVVDRAAGTIRHERFNAIANYLQPDDCLVLNDTRVIPARFAARRASGGAIEVLYQHQRGTRWLVLLKPSARLEVGERLQCAAHETQLVLEDKLERGAWLVRPDPPISAFALLEAIGETPLPPYIRRPEHPTATDAERYQTVYAQTPGAIAAPTAGLHFTTALLDELERRGTRVANVTLHVGVGTFTPVQTDDLRQHHMHAEWFQLEHEAVETMQATRRAGGRLVGVGTTVCRVLESIPATFGKDPLPLTSAEGWTDLFIYPPYAFHNLDALVTNFHLPESTLLALVMAFGGAELVREAYETAVKERYRFFSYGDAMLLI